MCSEKIKIVTLTTLAFSVGLLSAQQSVTGGVVPDPQVHSAATSDGAYPSQLSGTVVDTSGAAIAGAAIQVRSADGSLDRATRSDIDGSFIVAGLPIGRYRLVVSKPGFETQEIPVTLAAGGAAVPLRISLALGSVITTVNVQGREDDLIGIASSSTQGTVGAVELQDRPILRSGEVLETVPG